MAKLNDLLRRFDDVGPWFNVSLESATPAFEDVSQRGALIRLRGILGLPRKIRSSIGGSPLLQSDLVAGMED